MLGAIQDKPTAIMGAIQDKPKVMMGAIQDKPTESMQFMLDPVQIQTRQEVEQVKADLTAAENDNNPLHGAHKVHQNRRGTFRVYVNHGNFVVGWWS